MVYHFPSVIIHSLWIKSDSTPWVDKSAALLSYGFQQVNICYMTGFTFGFGFSDDAVQVESVPSPLKTAGLEEDDGF